MPDTDPSIGVLVVTHNFERFIGECLESLLAQTCRPAEVVVSDDCSTDGTWSIVERVAAEYPRLIRSYRQPRNLGVVGHCNVAKKLLRADLVSYMDGDDRWHPEKLALEIAALQAMPGAEAAYSNVRVIDAEGNAIGLWHDPSEALPCGDILAPVLARRIFSRSRNAYRNHLVSRRGVERCEYDGALDSFFDWDEKIDLAARLRFASVSRATVDYRRHKGGFSASDPEKHLRGYIQVRAKNAWRLSRLGAVEAFSATCNMGCDIVQMLVSCGASRVWGGGVGDLTPGGVVRHLCDSYVALPTRVRKAVSTYDTRRLREAIAAATEFDAEMFGPQAGLALCWQLLRVGWVADATRSVARLTMPRLRRALWR